MQEKKNEIIPSSESDGVVSYRKRGLRTRRVVGHGGPPRATLRCCGRDPGGDCAGSTAPVRNDIIHLLRSGFFPKKSVLSISWKNRVSDLATSECPSLISLPVLLRSPAYTYSRLPL